jgi:LytR cell envelope-related transcriptional attenuator
MKKRLIKVIIAILVALIIYMVYMNFFAPKKSSVAYTLKQLGSKIILPENQSPRIAKIETATVLDQLKAQPFFQNTQLSDTLVVYPDRVIVYRSASDKIVSMGSLDPSKSAQLFGGATVQPGTSNAGFESLAITQPQPAAAVSSTASTVEVRNGTKTVGLAKKLAETFTVLPGLAKPVTGNAANKNYTKTVLVITGKPAAESISALEKALGTVATSTLPAGEAASTADITIIVGTNQ